MKIEFALIGPPLEPFYCDKDIQGRSDYEARWDERPRVSFEIPAEMPLGDAIDKAADIFGIRVPEDLGEIVNDVRVSRIIAGVSFYWDAPEANDSWGSLTYPVINDDGTIQWGRPVVEVPYGKLVEAADAGLIGADPHRVFLRPAPPGGGDYLGVDWDSILQAWRATEAVLAHLANAGGGIGLIYGTWTVTRKALERVREKWKELRADINRIGTLVDKREWTSSELCTFLACSLEDIRAIMPVFGIQESGDGVWRRSDDSETRILVQLCRATSHAVEAGLTIGGDGEQLIRALRMMLDQLESSGALTDEAMGEIISKALKSPRVDWEPPK